MNERILKRVILIGLSIIIIIVIAKVAFPQSLVIPTDRLHNFSIGFWDKLLHRNPIFTVNAEVSNSKDKPITLLGKCLEVNIDPRGNLKATGKTFEVFPERLTVYPGERNKRFQIHFTSEKGAYLCNFQVSPVVEKKEKGIQVVIAYAYLFGVNVLGREKYNPDLVFESRRVGNIVYTMIANTGNFVAEATLRLVKGNEVFYARHCFIQPHSKRYLDHPDTNATASILDVVNGPLLGRKLFQ